MAKDNHPSYTTGFDARERLRRARASGDLTEKRAIMLRLVWLRQDVPQVRVDTSMVRLDGEIVVMLASITLPDGGQASGHAAAEVGNAGDLADIIELTETRAMGRALDLLGYIEIDPPDTAAGTEHDGEEQTANPVATAQRQPPEHVQALRQMKDRAQPDNVAPESSMASAARTATGRNRTEPKPDGPGTDASGTVQSVSGDDPPLEDVSWTSFWSWARATYQLGSRGQLEQLLAQSVGNKSPGELRTLLHRHFQETESEDS